MCVGTTDQDKRIKRWISLVVKSPSKRWCFLILFAACEDPNLWSSRYFCLRRKLLRPLMIFAKSQQMEDACERNGKSCHACRLLFWCSASNGEIRTHPTDSILYYINRMLYYISLVKKKHELDPQVDNNMDELYLKTWHIGSVDRCSSDKRKSPPLYYIRALAHSVYFPMRITHLRDCWKVCPPKKNRAV